MKTSTNVSYTRTKTCSKNTSKTQTKACFRTHLIYIIYINNISVKQVQMYPTHEQKHAQKHKQKHKQKHVLDHT